MIRSGLLNLFLNPFGLVHNYYQACLRSSVTLYTVHGYYINEL